MSDVFSVAYNLSILY